MVDPNSIIEKFSLLDYVPAGMCLIEKNYMVLFWNRCLEDWTGIKRDEIFGTCLVDSFPKFDEPMYRSRIDTIFGGGPPAIFSSQLHRYIFPAKLPDGEMRFQSSIVTSIPALDNSGFYALIAVEDVTELTRRMNEYREMKDKALNEIKQRKLAEGKSEKLILELKETLAEVKTLKGFIPICSNCKKIRSDEGYWRQIEEYIEKYSDAKFSHGLCPGCEEKLYGHLDWYKKMKIKNEKNGG